LSGDCCSTASNCPTSYNVAASCDSPLQSCQGHRLDRACVSSQCTNESVPDDSACSNAISKSCTPLAPVTCNSALNQVPLVCPTNCSSDANCADPTTMFCQNPGPSGTCVSKLPDGSACTGSNQCIHNCLNNFCCNATSGHCCSVASNCPAQYAAASSCDGAQYSCQGHRKDKTCTNSVCGSATVDDDTGCNTSFTRTCSPYKNLTCSAASSQSAMVCATSCTADNQCASGFHCYGGRCISNGNGNGCSSGGQCTSGNCWSNVCCNTACNNTTCDTCYSGSCNAYSAPHETGNTCGSAYWLGSGQFGTDLYSTIQNSGDSSDWYSLYASDADHACFWPVNDYGHLVVTLDMPGGVDYDLYVWKGSCAGLSLVRSSTGTGTQDRVDYEEDCGGDDAAYYFIEVRRWSGFSCSAQYHLTVSAHL
jgi:hypothetical protein